MAVRTYTIYNPVDGNYDTFHWDPTNPPATGPTTLAVASNTGTTNGKKDSNRDTDRATAEAR